MDSDRHFLIQNGLSGLILAAFALLGAWLVDPPTAALASKAVFGSLESLAALALAPVLGIMIQGSVLAVHYALVWHPYKGTVRELAATHIKDALRSDRALDGNVRSILEGAPEDSLFSWYYYTRAEERLIEWARRRRDFQHLGENWLAASALGLLGGLGACWSWINGWLTREVLVGVAVGGSGAWVLGLLYLRWKMKRDADTMELMWGLNQLRPGLRDAIDSPQIDPAPPSGSNGPV